MINLNTDKQLNIIMANKNRALKEVLKDASAKELKTLSEGKDLKSILGDIFKQSIQNNSQDKLLLNLLKNNPTFKELGNVTNSINNLLDTLKQDKNPLAVQKTLQTFLNSIKNISEKDLIAKIKNSGIFLESKIKALQMPTVKLKDMLQELSKLLSSTTLNNVKEINTQLKELLSTPLFKNISNNEILNIKNIDIKSLLAISDKTKTILNKLNYRLASKFDKTISPNDVLFTNESKKLLEKLNILNKPENLSAKENIKEIFSQDLKSILLKTQEDIKSSTHPNKQEILKNLNKLSLQIDYYQLLSHLSNSSALYIPYSWDSLENGNITIKNLKNDKFFTDIELKLKKFGELKLRLGMFEKNQLNINITAKDEELKKILKENMPQLKKQLIDVGINPISIRFLDDKKNSSSAYYDSFSNLDINFEVKV